MHPSITHPPVRSVRAVTAVFHITVLDGGGQSSGKGTGFGRAESMEPCRDASVCNGPSGRSH
eukprot:5180887-Prymnesium_polylepis.1